MIRDAVVGLTGISGLSTEQRKRLTIAVELVANPGEPCILLCGYRVHVHPVGRFGCSCYCITPFAVGWKSSESALHAFQANITWAGTDAACLVSMALQGDKYTDIVAHPLQTA